MASTVQNSPVSETTGTDHRIHHQFLKPQHLRGHKKKTGRWRGWPFILRVWTVGQMAPLHCRLARTTHGISGLDICHTSHCLFFCLAWPVERRLEKTLSRKRRTALRTAPLNRFSSMLFHSSPSLHPARIRMLWPHVVCTWERAKTKMLPGL